jgi:hypothetical protein
MDTVKMTSQEFLDLLTYSTSNPTGISIGKQWKRETRGVWYLCEYIASNAPGYVDIKKSIIQIDNPIKRKSGGVVDPPPFFFAWYDFYIGFYYDRHNKILYFAPFPTLVFVLWRGTRKDPSN